MRLTSLWSPCVSNNSGLTGYATTKCSYVHILSNSSCTTVEWRFLHAKRRSGIEMISYKIRLCFIVMWADCPFYAKKHLTIEVSKDRRMPSTTESVCRWPSTFLCERQIIWGDIKYVTYLDGCQLLQQIGGADDRVLTLIRGSVSTIRLLHISHQTIMSSAKLIELYSPALTYLIIEVICCGIARNGFSCGWVYQGSHWTEKGQREHGLQFTKGSVIPLKRPQLQSQILWFNVVAHSSKIENCIGGLTNPLKSNFLRTNQPLNCVQNSAFTHNGGILKRM